MNERPAYIFLDWSGTINEIFTDDHLQKLINVFKAIELKLNCLVKMVVVSGTSQKSAIEKYNKLKSEFERSGGLNFFGGFAFEYGGFFIDEYGTFKKVLKAHTKLGKKINDLSLKYGFEKSAEYTLYYNFEFEKVDENVLMFVKDCKRNFKNFDFEFYNDQYGIGLDIKNKKLSKERFVKKFLKQNDAQFVIVGGDSVQDLRMLNIKSKVPHTFIGFKSSKILENKNIILSDKNNVLGIIDCLNKILESRLEV